MHLLTILLLVAVSVFGTHPPLVTRCKKHYDGPKTGPLGRSSFVWSFSFNNSFLRRWVWPYQVLRVSALFICTDGALKMVYFLGSVLVRGLSFSFCFLFFLLCSQPSLWLVWRSRMRSLISGMLQRHHPGGRVQPGLSASWRYLPPRSWGQLMCGWCCSDFGIWFSCRAVRISVVRKPIAKRVCSLKWTRN